MARPSVSRAEIESALSETLGKISARRPLSPGEESQTFSFHHGSDEYVVRVNQKAAGFEKDLFAYRHFARPELPIPEILSIAPLGGEHTISVSRRAPGLTLQDLDVLALTRIVGPTARVLEAVASSDVSAIRGYGTFDSDGHGSETSWRSFLVSIADRKRHEWATDFIDIREVDRLLHLVRALAENCPEERKLIHGDFGSNNVLTEDGRITGVIDWSEAAVGDPLYDIANIFFWRTWLDCMEWQARYFEPLVNGEAQGRERLLCYQLHIGLRETFASAREGRLTQAAWALKRCLTIAG